MIVLSRQQPRVVITGIGPVTPLGIGVDAFWDSLRNGRSGVGPIQAFDASPLKVRIAAEVPDFDPGQYMDGKAAKRMARFAQLAVAAARLALADANLDLSTVDRDRIASVINTGGGGITTIAAETESLLKRGPGRVSPFFVPVMAANMASCQVAIELGLGGPAITSAAACASSIYAFIDSLHMLQFGEAEIAFAGGTESNVSMLGIAGLANMHALSRRNDEPERASRPFDADRDGFVFGEGAVVCVLEPLPAAQARGARIYAEVLGGGRTADAYHITAPKPDGSGAARAMQLALDNADLAPTDIDYICAHGTGTPLNDLAETRAIKAVFRDHAYRLAVSSPKSMTGHLMGAAGGLSVAATALAIHQGEIPPTINLDTPDPDCDLDYVANTSRRAGVRAALASGFGFGGQNGVVALGRVDR
ncbi:MAG: beta-ketoacyl-ACP synthase II [Dehalococcoidia bacterium]